MFNPLLGLLVLISLRDGETPSRMLDLERMAMQYTVPQNLRSTNSSHDDFAPSYDPTYERLVFTSDRLGLSRSYAVATDSVLAQGANAVAVQGTMNEEGTSRAWIRIGLDGSVVGTAWMRHRHRSYAGLVSVARDGDAFNCGAPIDVVNGEYFTSHPTISPDGSRLVFSSSRGGSDNLDLYVSERLSGGHWREPVLLGASVSSVGDEISPYFVSADTLVFASNGMGGRGGFDLFLTVYRDGRWQEPEPLEFCNSEFDDSDFIRMPNGDILFASNRPGGAGGFDLYLSRLR